MPPRSAAPLGEWTLLDGAPSVVAAPSLEALREVSVAMARELLREAEVSLVLEAPVGGDSEGRGEGAAGALDAKGDSPVVRDAERNGVWQVLLDLGEFSGCMTIVGAPLPVPQDVRRQVHALGHLVATAGAALVERLRLESDVIRHEAALRKLSHDVRTPLNNLRLGLGLVRSRANDEVSPTLARVERGVDRIVELIDELSEIRVRSAR